jgi:hypothetical protein
VNVAVVVTPVDAVITSGMPTEAVKLNPTAKELDSRNGIVQVFHMIQIPRKGTSDLRVILQVPALVYPSICDKDTLPVVPFIVPVIVSVPVEQLGAACIEIDIGC